MSTLLVVLVLDLLGAFAFALNGALTALRTVRVDIMGVLALAMVTAMGGGVIRDVLLGSLPPATFVDWRYLAAAAAGGSIAFLFGTSLDRFSKPINIADAAGLSLFAVTGATKALELGAGPVQAAILGMVTGVGGGTLRDVMIREVPSVLSSGLYAIPALVGASLTVIAVQSGLQDLFGVPVAVYGAAVCFAIRIVGLRFRVDAPRPPRAVQ